MAEHPSERPLSGLIYRSGILDQTVELLPFTQYLLPTALYYSISPFKKHIIFDPAYGSASDLNTHTDSCINEIYNTSSIIFVINGPFICQPHPIQIYDHDIPWDPL